MTIRHRKLLNLCLHLVAAVGILVISNIVSAGSFVAVGNNGTAVYSDDRGATWTISNHYNQSMRDIAFGNGRFVAVGDRVSYSDDFGLTWTAASTPPANNMGGVTFANGRFVAVGGNGNGAYSDDNGATWTNTSHNNGNMFDVAYGNGTYVAVGLGGVASYSTDGINWTNSNHNNGQMNSVAFGNNVFVAVGGGTDPDYIAASFSTDNGQTWHTASDFGVGNTNGVAFGNNRFVTVGRSSAGRIRYSDDNGDTWSDANFPAVPLTAVAFGNNRFVAINDTTSVTSKDGINWSLGGNHNNPQPAAIAFGQGPVPFNYSGTCATACGNVGLIEGQGVAGVLILDPAAAVPGNILAEGDIVEFDFVFGTRHYQSTAGDFIQIRGGEVRINSTGNGITGEETAQLQLWGDGGTFSGAIWANDSRWQAALPPSYDSALGPGTFNPPEVGTTPSGNDIEVTPVVVDEDGNPASESTSIIVEYDSISTAGETTVEILQPSEGPPPPDGLRLGDDGVYLDFNTTASFTGSIQVCLGYDEGDFLDESAVTVQHYDGVAWTDVTIRPEYPDVINNLVCGLVPSFSIVVAMEPLPDVVLLCSGFEPPLANGPVKVKKNRVLPFKTQLINLDGLLPVVNTDIVSPPVIQVMYASDQEENVLDVTDDALNAGVGTDGNQFEFEDDYWQYNLKTKNYTAAGTYTVNLLTGDDAEYSIEMPTCSARFVID